GIRWHQDAKPGEILRRFDRAWNGLWHIQFSTVQSTVPSVLSFILVLVIGFFLHWQLTLIALLPVPLAVFVALTGSIKLSKLQDKINKKWEKIFSVTGDFFSNIVSIKTNTAEKRTTGKVMGLLQTALRRQLVMNKWWATLEAAQESFTVVARILIFVFGVIYVVNGSLSLGTLITFLGFTTFIYVPLQTVLGNELSRLTESYIGLNRIVPWWNLVPEIQEVEKPIKPKRVRGEIEFKNVSFSYKDEGAIRGVSFRVPAGSTTALVGESGSGKSTLAALINRLYDPSKGTILIDGHKLQDLSIQSLRSNIGYVLQENLLFHDTIMNNIRFAKPGASRDEVVSACKRAQAHDFISKLPMKYNSIVGERGVKLSGGEKQRVVIARTLLKDPPILVLDEATSALDSKTEHELQLALAEVMQDRTTVVIAHRLSTIMNADQILVFSNGRLAERGAHKQLSRFGKIYRELWSLQAGGYEK
ncbi:MAG: ABC transporter ATP-binding protein, partial [Candidatus Uhrbacteria bacterium]